MLYHTWNIFREIPSSPFLKNIPSASTLGNCNFLREIYRRFLIKSAKEDILTFQIIVRLNNF